MGSNIILIKKLSIYFLKIQMNGHWNVIVIFKRKIIQMILHFQKEIHVIMYIIFEKKN